MQSFSKEKQNGCTICNVFDSNKSPKAKVKRQHATGKK